MRIACALITHLRAKAELRRHAHLRDSRIAIVDRTYGKPLVVDSSAGASVRAGMTLEQAMSYHNGLIILDADEPYYRRVFEDVTEALLQVSDRVESAELGTAYARLDGLELLNGSEAQAAASLLDAVPRWMQPRVGVGSGKFTSYVAARFAEAQSVVVCPTDEPAFLAPLSIGLLPVSGGLKKALRGFGIRTMGQLSALPRDTLSDRFGREGALAWAFCSGIDDRPVVALKPDHTVIEHVSLPFASASIELLLAAVDILLQRAFSHPLLRLRLAGALTLEGKTDGSAVWIQKLAFKEPVSDWRSAAGLVRDRIEAQPPEAPLEDLTVTVSDIRSESGRQLGLLGRASDRRRERIAELDAKLRAKTGDAPTLHRVVEVAPWHPVPEMRALKAPLNGGDAFTPLRAPTPVDVRESESHRPLAVRRDKAWRKIARIDDLWRFDLWWLPSPISRSCFSVIDEDGRRIALFRDERDGCWYRQPLTAV